MRVTWDASLGDITGYKLTLVPMLAGMKRQELYVGSMQTSVNVRDLSPETEYEISLFALKGLTPSEAVMAMEKTQPVKVSLGETQQHTTESRDCSCDLQCSICSTTQQVDFTHSSPTKDQIG